MDEDMQWIMAWWAAAFLAIGLGAYTRDVGIGFLSAGFLGFGIIGVSIIVSSVELKFPQLPEASLP